MTRVTPMLIVTIFLTSLLFIPSVFVFGGSNALTNIDVTPESQALLAQIPHNARVAIYDEDNLTVPVVSYASNLTNNLAEITTLLEGAGHSVDLLTEEDILNHELMTADFDVFILVNNVPRPSIEHLVKEFSLGGGGLLTMNSAVSYLWYGGYIFADQDYDVGYGIWWGYFPSDSQNVTSRHPTMKDYHINDTVYERSELWATSWTPKLEEARGNDMILLMDNATEPEFITAFAIDNTKDGGRIVQLPGDGSSIPTDFESIILDSVDWLVPRPKGRIVYDLSHSPRLAVDIWDDLATVYFEPNVFTQFRTLAVNHTYTFDKLYPLASGNLTAERLAKYDVLIIVWPDLNYTTAEYLAVEEWVDGGGSLLVLGDRTGLSGGGPGNTYINMMLQNFDMSLGTTDVLDFDSMTPGTHVTLENCFSLAIGYRNYLSVLGTATSIWFDGTDPVVAGQSFGQGRAILSADMNIFDDYDLPLDDNARFALNVLNWLTANDAELLVFTDYGYSLSYRDPVSLALNDLGIPYQLFTTSEYIDDFLDSKSWGLFILNEMNWQLTGIELDEIYAYVDAGGKLLMSYHDMDAHPSHPLWSKLGVEHSLTLSGAPMVYLWDVSHPIFSEPNDHSAFNYSSGNALSDDGDAVTIREGYTALAGSTADVQDGRAVIVVSNDRQTLFNPFLIDNFETDEDDSTYEDRIELWQNEITYMMTPGGGTPFPIDTTTLLIIGAAVVGIIVIGVVVSRRRGGGSAPKRKPKKKTTKKKK